MMPSRRPRRTGAPTGRDIHESQAILASACLALSALAAPASAQETGITVRSIRVLATDAEALAKFYAPAFGMSETRRPVHTATFNEIVLNSGSTPELRRRPRRRPRSSSPRRGKDREAGAMAALILEVPDMDAAIAARRRRRQVMRQVAKSGEGLSYAFLTDPEGNQIELLLRK